MVLLDFSLLLLGSTQRNSIDRELGDATFHLNSGEPEGKCPLSLIISTAIDVAADPWLPWWEDV